MLWQNQRESDNVVDRRGWSGPTALGAGGLIVGAIIYTLMGGNPFDFIAQNTGHQASVSSPARQGANDEEKRFSAVVLADTEDVWNAIFRQKHLSYKEPKLVLFTGAVRSACGTASSAVGPFYCPLDQQVYLDLGFFNQLSSRLGARGDFAQAYVIAHEVGHHVQNLLGLERRQNPNGLTKNQLSVETELQADCLAGVWARQTQDVKHVVEEGDIDEALNAAAAVGDDRLQRAATGEVVPDSFTHGSSAQRVAAFRLGYEKQFSDCLSGFK